MSNIPALLRRLEEKVDRLLASEENQCKLLQSLEQQKSAAPPMGVAGEVNGKSRKVRASNRSD